MSPFYLRPVDKRKQIVRISNLRSNYPSTTKFRRLIRKFVRRVATERALLGPIIDIGAGYRSNEPEVCAVHLYDYYTADIDSSVNADFAVDAVSLPPEWTDRFGTVVCTELLEHTPHPQKVVDELYRILHPNGYLLLTVPFWVPVHEKRHLSDYWRFTTEGVRFLLSAFDVLLLQTSRSKSRPLGVYVLAKKPLTPKYILTEVSARP